MRHNRLTQLMATMGRVESISERSLSILSTIIKSIDLFCPLAVGFFHSFVKFNLFILALVHPLSTFTAQRNVIDYVKAHFFPPSLIGPYWWRLSAFVRCRTIDVVSGGRSSIVLDFHWMRVQQPNQINYANMTNHMWNLLEASWPAAFTSVGMFIEPHNLLP